VQPSITIIL